MRESRRLNKVLDITLSAFTSRGGRRDVTRPKREGHRRPHHVALLDDHRVVQEAQGQPSRCQGARTFDTQPLAPLFVHARNLVLAVAWSRAAGGALRAAWAWGMVHRSCKTLPIWQKARPSSSSTRKESATPINRALHWSRERNTRALYTQSRPRDRTNGKMNRIHS